MAESRLCSILDCCKPAKTRGWCAAHYHRWREHGDPKAGGTAKGEVLSYYRNTVLRFSSEECLIWPYSNTDGYGKIFIDGKFKRVPRLACEETHGPPPSPAHQAAHSCGNGHLGCVNPKHLRWATPKENNMDKKTHGTLKSGAEIQTSRLTEDDVRAIRRLAKSHTQRFIAAKFGVDQSNISQIVKRKTWAHVT